MLRALLVRLWPGAFALIHFLVILAAAVLVVLALSRAPGAPAPSPRKPPPAPAITPGELASRDWDGRWNGMHFVTRFLPGGAYLLYPGHDAPDSRAPSWAGTWRLEGGVLYVTERSQPNNDTSFVWHVTLRRDGTSLVGGGKIVSFNDSPSGGDLRFSLVRR